MKPESTVTSCACGVQYERQDARWPIKDIGLFECVECGARIEIWSGRTVPVFKRSQSARRATTHRLVGSAAIGRSIHIANLGVPA